MAWQALQEAIQFGTAFKFLLGQILSTDPLYGPFFLSKVVLSNAYMRVWVHLEELPRFAFIASLHPLDSDPLIGFHLSLTMGFMDSAHFFCCTTETAADMVNASWAEGHASALHPLNDLVNLSPAASDDDVGGLPDPDMDRDLDKLCRNHLAVEATSLCQ